MYGETVSFRLKGSIPDHANALEVIRQIKYDRADWFARAILAYAEQPIQNDNAATAVELHEMISELLRALGEANQLIDKLARGRVVTDQDRQDIGNLKVSQEFVEKMREQQRAARSIRPPSNGDDEE